MSEETTAATFAKDASAQSYCPSVQDAITAATWLPFTA